jgi:hypothetical protein
VAAADDDYVKRVGETHDVASIDGRCKPAWLDKRSQETGVDVF